MKEELWSNVAEEPNPMLSTKHAQQILNAYQRTREANDRVNKENQELKAEIERLHIENVALLSALRTAVFRETGYDPAALTALLKKEQEETP